MAPTQQQKQHQQQCEKTRAAGYGRRGREKKERGLSTTLAAEQLL